jgi:hypothetical protein
MNETLTVCTVCELGGALKRIPSLVNISSKKKDEQTSGQRVKEFIKTARKELSDQAQEARKDYEH